MSNSSNDQPSTPLRLAIVLRVHEGTCDIASDDGPVTVRYVAQFPSPRTEPVSLGHLVIVAEAPDGTAVVVWRRYDAVALGEQNDPIKMWGTRPRRGVGPAKIHLHCTGAGHARPPVAGLPGADWWVAGPVAAGRRPR